MSSTAPPEPGGGLPLWLRAVGSTLVLPGLVAGVIPLLLPADGLGLETFRWAGVIPLGAGLLVLGWTISDFATVGGGTLAPWDPPQQLVGGRLYRIVRNPMYLGVLAIIGGLGLLRQSAAVLGYGAAMAIVFHLRVIGWEEPALRRQFGVPYEAYLTRTPRWVPRWRRGSR